ncbi:MAG: hypothetical protein H0W76_07205 [Pyrinomonadaceae bacterium]|nr:hypothetical protein [Pyrinomonadaceae bacterium]
MRADRVSRGTVQTALVKNQARVAKRDACKPWNGEARAHHSRVFESEAIAFAE